MDKQNKNELVFSICIEDLQNEAIEKMGRMLTDDEIEIAKKGLEMGLLTDINSIYNTIFFEMI